MQYFAKIENDIVQKVIVVDSDFVKSLDGEWVETFMEENERKNYAGIGYKYNKLLNGFISPKPFNSWSLDTIKCKWKTDDKDFNILTEEIEVLKTDSFDYTAKEIIIKQL